MQCNAVFLYVQKTNAHALECFERMGADRFADLPKEAPYGATTCVKLLVASSPELEERLLLYRKYEERRGW